MVVSINSRIMRSCCSDISVRDFRASIFVLGGWVVGFDWLEIAIVMPNLVDESLLLPYYKIYPFLPFLLTCKATFLQSEALPILYQVVC